MREAGAFDRRRNEFMVHAIEVDAGTGLRVLLAAHRHRHETGLIGLLTGGRYSIASARDAVDQVIGKLKVAEWVLALGPDDCARDGVRNDPWDQPLQLNAPRAPDFVVN